MRVSPMWAGPIGSSTEGRGRCAASRGHARPVPRVATACAVDARKARICGRLHRDEGDVTRRVGVDASPAAPAGVGGAQAGPALCVERRSSRPPIALRDAHAVRVDDEGDVARGETLRVRDQQVERAPGDGAGAETRVAYGRTGPGRGAATGVHCAQALRWARPGPEAGRDGHVPPGWRRVGPGPDRGGRRVCAARCGLSGLGPERGRAGHRCQVASPPAGSGRGGRRAAIPALCGGRRARPTRCPAQGPVGPLGSLAPRGPRHAAAPSRSDAAG